MTVNDVVLATLLVLIGIFLFFGTINLLLAIRFRPTAPTRPHPNPGRVAILVPIRDDPSIFNSLPFLRAIDYPDYEVVLIDDSQLAAFRRRVDASAGGAIRALRRPPAGGRQGAALNVALRRP